MSRIPENDQEQSIVTMLRGLLDTKDETQIREKLMEWVESNPDAVPEALFEQLKSPEVSAESLLDSLVEVTDLSAIKDPELREKVARKKAARDGVRRSDATTQEVAQDKQPSQDEAKESNIVPLRDPDSPKSPSQDPTPKPPTFTPFG